MPTPMRVRYAKIRELRDQLLAKYSVIKPAIPLAKIANGEGARIVKSEFDDDWSGFLLRGAAQPTIGVNKRHGENRQRFTIAHELGHLLLHDGDEVHIDKTFRINFRDESAGLGTAVEEIESNTFAAWLLMPEQFLVNDVRAEHLDINDELAVSTLASRYKVSQQAMTIRLMRLAQGGF